MAPSPSRTVLDNGVRVITQPMPQLRSIALGVWIDAGARDESPEQNGLAHLIEHMIFKGTARRSAYEIAKSFDAIGGQTNAFTSPEHICFHAKVMDVHLEQMTDIMTDILLNSTFDPMELERERPVILQEISMLEEAPEELVHVLAGRQVWGDTGLGRSILGTRQSVSGFDAETARGFFNQLCCTDRVVVTAAGNLDHAAVVDLLAPAFEQLAAGNGRGARTPPTHHAGLACHDRPIEQTHICLNTPGLAINDPRRYAYTVLNTVLGGNMSSRLFQEIREQRGLAYSVYSYAAAFADTGTFGVYAGVAPERAAETVGLIRAALERIQSEFIDAQTLKGAQDYATGNLLIFAESNDNQMVRLAQNELYFGRHIPLAEVIENVAAVSEEDVRQLAQLLFTPESMALTVLGPAPDPNRLAAVLTG